MNFFLICIFRLVLVHKNRNQNQKSWKLILGTFILPGSCEQRASADSLLKSDILVQSARAYRHLALKMSLNWFKIQFQPLISHEESVVWVGLTGLAWCDCEHQSYKLQTRQLIFQKFTLRSLIERVVERHMVALQSIV